MMSKLPHGDVRHGAVRGRGDALGATPAADCRRWADRDGGELGEVLHQPEVKGLRQPRGVAGREPRNGAEDPKEDYAMK